MKLAIPAFYGIDQTFTDSTGQQRNCWQSIEAAASKVGIVVPDASFADLPQQNPGAMPSVYQQFDRCRAKGQKILGYVAARDKKLARRDPTADIQKWYQGYTDPQGILHIDGIYYDIAVLPQDTDRSGQQAFFTNLVNSLHSTYPAGHTVAMLLAGQCPEEWVVQVADYVLMWETDEQPYLNSFVADPPPQPPETNPPGWWANPGYTDKISHTVGLVPNNAEMSTVVTRARSRNAGLVYVQDISTLVGYPRLPPYFDDEVAALPTEFLPVYAQGDPGNGIGGYDLKSSADQVFAFDYNGSGRLDHLALYRPGTGTIWILSNNGGQFTPVYAQGDPGNGIGGYDLKSPADRAFAFDYDGSGKLDHLALYRPGTGTIWILEKR